MKKLLRRQEEKKQTHKEKEIVMTKETNEIDLAS
jgi:hypothetical protein